MGRLERRLQNVFVLAGPPNIKVLQMRDNIIFSIAQGTHNYQEFMQHPWMDNYHPLHLPSQLSTSYDWPLMEVGGGGIEQLSKLRHGKIESS